jgi:hypothetical protein
VAGAGDKKQSDSPAHERRGLPLARPGQAQLEQPTIMNRLLAAQYGGAYVQLAAFAIDIDRMYVEHSGAVDARRKPALPFGWEVFVTECHMLGRVDPSDVEQHVLIEDTCVAILEQEPDEQGYGSQFLFAAYDAIERGFYPKELAAVFQSWRKRPKQLLSALSAFWQAPARELALCARTCLAQTLDPPLAPPAREALQAMAQEQWALPPLPVRSE